MGDTAQTTSIPTSRPLVSVVTPFHNTADYLRQCIESVLAQDFADFEYILVNNCSTDSSAEIAAEFADRDRRIRLIHTETLLPQLTNYNFALSQISPNSTYTKMCQADDWLHPRCLTEMVALAEADDDVAIVSSYSFMGRELIGVGLPPDVSVLSGRQACAALLKDNVFLFGSPTTVMYRSAVVRARRDFFVEGRVHADTELCFEVLDNADFGFVHQVLSYLRLQDDSITGRAKSMLPRYLDRLIVVKSHGRRCLDQGEYQTTLEATIHGYYRALARRWLIGPIQPLPPGFLDYHKRGLASAGMRFDRRRFALSALTEIVSSVCSPLDTVARIRSK
jgi:glycosyltransferase involved in cell wall biosynthesis